MNLNEYQTVYTPFKAPQDVAVAPSDIRDALQRMAQVEDRLSNIASRLCERLDVVCTPASTSPSVPDLAKNTHAPVAPLAFEIHGYLTSMTVSIDLLHQTLERIQL